MSSPPPLPLARRTAAGVVVDERPARVVCRWTDLPSADGERFELEWSSHVSCVDTPADRALLCERLMDSGDATLGVERVARLIADEVRAAVARWIADRPAAESLAGDSHATLGALIEADARRVGFAAGLKVSAPFTLHVESPTVRRAQDAARARKHLDALTADAAMRDEATDELRRGLASGEGAAAVRAARRVDPRDLLRAVAAADARWEATTPSLWAVAGDALVRIDPTQPDLSAKPIAVSGVGPLRSVRGATIDGQRRLLVGGRDGVAIVDPDRGASTLFARPASGETGFNAACVLGDELLATHAGHGLVRWRLSDPKRPSTLVSLGAESGGGKLIVAAGDDVALLLDGRGELLRVGVRDDSATPIGASADAVIALATLGDGRAVIADVGRHVAIVHPRDPAGGPIVRARVASPVESVATIDLCGVPRVVVVDEAGAATLLDPETGGSVALGVGRWPARLVRARHGFAAMLGVDRTRVAILDLSRPDSAPSELHVQAMLGRRVADLCFA